MVVNNERYGLVALVGTRNVHNKGALLAIDSHGHVLLISDLCSLAGAIDYDRSVVAGTAGRLRRFNLLRARRFRRFNSFRAGRSVGRGPYHFDGHAGLGFALHLVDKVGITIQRELEHRQQVAFFLESLDCTLVGQHKGAVAVVCTDADELRAFCKLAQVEGDDSLDVFDVVLLENLAKGVDHGHAERTCVRVINGEHVAFHVEGDICGVGVGDNARVVFAAEAECAIFGASGFIAAEVECVDFYTAEQTAGNLGFDHAVNAPGKSLAAEQAEQCQASDTCEFGVTHKYSFFMIPFCFHSIINLHIYCRNAIYFA